MTTQWIIDFSGMSYLFAGHPKKLSVALQKTIVNKQKREMQKTFKCHLNLESVSTQKLKPPKINNRIGKVVFIVVKVFRGTPLAP